MKNFETNVSKIPDNIWRSILIESNNQKNFSDTPFVYSNENSVNIKKIIGSKAVFDVDCKDQNCWFVYNIAALRGWNAYSGSQKISIHKANLGFIGIQLNQGKHFLWLEYRPFIRDVSLIITLIGWIFITFNLFFIRNNGELRYRSL